MTIIAFIIILFITSILLSGIYPVLIPASESRKRNETGKISGKIWR